MKCSKNPLDILFRDIQREIDRGRQPKPPRHQNPPSTYANPLNWRLGRVIELIHQEAGSLGVFQEYFHISSPTARRLLPANPSLIPSTTELVWGSFWLHAKFQASTPEDSDEEIHAIEARFHELMEEEFED